MLLEKDRDVTYYTCLICGNKVFPGFPKRSGTATCKSCGKEYTGGLDSGFCLKCVPRKPKLCVCGELFFPKKGQKYHTKACRKFSKAIQKVDAVVSEIEGKDKKRK